MKKYYIGVVFNQDEGRAVDSKTTQAQIEEVRRLNCKLVGENDEALNWDIFDNPDKPQTLFQAILIDRKLRIDERNYMADRPNFAVVTADGNNAVRLEYYEGHDYLSKVYDIRSKELKGQKLNDTYKGW